MTQTPEPTPKLTDQPYIIVWYKYKNNIDQIRKYIACLPDRIGDRHWKIFLHDHNKNDSCNADCDIMEKVVDASH